MKTTLVTPFAIAAALSFASAADDRTLGEKTADTLDKAKDKTVEAGKFIGEKTKNAAEKVIDAVTPDSDARRIEVKITEHRINMPLALEDGKTAFVVHNASPDKRNFEIQGEGIDKKFLTGLGPDETKVLHVNLKRGTYKAYGWAKEGDNEAPKVNLTVK
jgi:hypothetical protein